MMEDRWLSVDEIAEYLGEEIEEPLTRVIDARIAAAQEQVKPQTPEPAVEPAQPAAPSSAPDLESHNDAVLDRILSGDTAGAAAMQRPSAQPQDGFIK